MKRLFPFEISKVNIKPAIKNRGLAAVILRFANLTTLIFAGGLGVFLLASNFRANVTTQGIVLGVGHSTVSSDPSVILYTYDVPGYPRNGNPGSYQREQSVPPADLALFKANTKVAVEYSRAVPGS